MLSKSRFIEMFSEYKTKQLSDISDITMGQSPDSNTYNSHGEGLAFYQGKTDFTDKYISSPKVWCKTPLRVARAGDILMSVRAPVGDVNITSKNCCIGRGLASIRPKNLESTEFIFLALQQSKHKIASIGKGSTFKAINKNDVFSIKIPDAPLSLQKDFSNFSIQLDKSKFILQQMIEKLELLKKSRFIEMFCKHYKEIKIGDVFTTTSGGTPSKTISEYYKEGTIPWLTSGEINSEIILKPKNFITEEGLKNSSAKLIDANSVVIAMYGATAGKVGVVKYQTSTNQAVCAILPHENYLPEYVFFAIKVQYQKLKALSAGAAQLNISQSKICSFKIKDAPIKQQEAFVNFINQIDKSKFICLYLCYF